MNEERLSGLWMFLIHRGMDHIPESEVIYQVKQNWHEWPNLVSFLTEFHVTTLQLTDNDTVKFRKYAPPCISPSKYTPPKIVTQKNLR